MQDENYFYAYITLPPGVRPLDRDGRIWRENPDGSRDMILYFYGSDPGPLNKAVQSLADSAAEMQAFTDKWFGIPALIRRAMSITF